MSRRKQSETLFAKACELMPGGVNSPVRAFQSVGGSPVYFTRGEGAYLFDVDGNKYADFCCSWGPLLFGHARKEVVEAVTKAAANGLSFGACTPAEIEMAELVRKQIPYIDMLRMTSSGTEAVMTAIRLARGFTGRSKIIKFEGCYHGHSDALLVKAGSGLLTGGISSSKGVTEKVAGDTIPVPYNDLKAVEKALSNEVAAVIVEPVAGNMGLVVPKPGFLQGLRELCDKTGSLLIFDEVINGFRFAPTSIGQLEHVTPDLTTLGKIIGGGMPAGAVGGKAEIMKMLAPLGPVYQAGTLSGNPVSLAAGLATLKLAMTENPYPKMSEQVKRIAKAINGLRLPVHCATFGGVFTVFFTERETLENLSEVMTCNTSRYAAFFHAMLDKGFYLPPSQFELSFISAAHDDALIDAYIDAARDALRQIFQ